MNHDEAEEYFRRHGPLYGFLVACAIMAVMVYALLFQNYNDAITNCDERNAQIAEVNARAPEINGMADTLTAYMEARLSGDRSKIAEGVPVVKRTIRELEKVEAEPVTITSCQESFSKPWPFG